MCGRYANHVQKMSGWEDILGDWPGSAELSINIAPTQNIPVVVQQSGHTQTKNMRWGLVPPWSKTAKTKYATFNARAETAQQKPSFRDACRNAQTCLIPASGYYEWSGEKGHKTKHFIQLENKTPLVMAGLWAFWTQGEQHLYSCTILTRAAVPSLSDIHPRMPIILDKQSAQNWLQPSPENNPGLQLEHLQRYDTYWLKVSTPA
jgi:putative SOS response-associated peptidase YedK